MSAKTCRRDSTETRARKWDGFESGARPIIDWALSEGARYANYYEPQPDTTVRGKVVRESVPALIGIGTRDGVVNVKPGDWIISGPEGQFSLPREARDAA